jgi:hypothetical protein
MSERALWCAVIAQAIEDLEYQAPGRNNIGQEAAIRESSKAFLTSERSNLAEICNWLNLPADKIRRRIAGRIA